MKLIINEFGSYLSKKENRFVIKTKDKTEEFSSDNVEQIIISSPSSISQSAIKLVIDRNIDIVFTSFVGKPFHIQNKGSKECNLYLFWFIIK